MQHCHYQARGCQWPKPLLFPPQVIAFNLGSLGFLTNFGFEEYQQTLQVNLFVGRLWGFCAALPYFEAGVLGCSFQK